jgi:hypothetical protein
MRQVALPRLRQPGQRLAHHGAAGPFRDADAQDAAYSPAVYSVALATMITIFPCCSGFSRLAAPPGMCSANGCPASADAQNLETETREELNYAKERLLANGDRPQCERQG